MILSIKRQGHFTGAVHIQCAECLFVQGQGKTQMEYGGKPAEYKLIEEHNEKCSHFADNGKEHTVTFT